MSSQTYNLQVLVYDATWNYSRWATLSFTTAPDNSVTGSFEYSGPTTELVGKKIPGTDSQDSFELDGGGVSIRISSYPSFGSEFPVAGVASINESGPYFLIGKQSQS
ncbi:MAG TPA: hypothetical protein VHE60_14040 [Pyrinomonadaceae bacterium]|nr:hypothetical protein [Pyrinomonadaceae bacterium]